MAVIYMKTEQIILIIAIILALLILAVLIFPKTNPITKIFKSSDSDKCKTPEGYTEQEWKEHMSHHPDLYKDCLQGGEK